MLRPQAPSVTLAILVMASIVGCRDWDRFTPSVVGEGGAAPSSSSSGSNASSGSSGSTASSGSTGGGGAGGSGTGGDACGTIDILSDDFDGDSLDWRWEDHGDGTYSTDGGDLLITMPDYEAYSQLQSTAAFDFRGRTMIMELVTPVNPGIGIWFNVARDPENYLEIYVDPDGLIYYNQETDGAFATFAGEALDPDEYRFWRFRENDGTVYFDLSNDGATWMERTSYDISTLIDPAYTSVYVGALTYGTGSPQEGRVARVYSGEPTSLGPCSTTVLSDDFEDASTASVWDDGWNGSACWVDESGGALNFSCNPAADDDAGYASMTVFDLTSSYASIEVVSPPEPGTDAFLDLVLVRPEAETLFGFHLHATELEMYLAIDGNYSQVAADPYEPSGGRFLRLREDAGTVYFERSPDNQQYEVVHAMPVPFDVTSVQVVLAGGAEGANTAGTTSTFDNFNLGP